MGTSYDTIRNMLNDRIAGPNLLGISVAKFWALVLSLGSGTTGGVFAPSLVVGGGLGAGFAMLIKHVAPHLVSDPAFYALAAMGGVFGGIARAPLTSIVFLFELSHNPNAILPLIVCVMISDAVVRLFSRESIMTVKLVKRGLIVLQDYSVPVLMRARIDQVMRKDFNQLHADDELRTVLETFVPGDLALIPVVNAEGSLVGIVEPHDLLRTESPDHHFTMRELARQDFVLAHSGESVDRIHREMMLKNTENVVVVATNDSRKPVGVARANDILQLRRWLLEEETGDRVMDVAEP
jgi:CBS domain-containing protein